MNVLETKELPAKGKWQLTLKAIPDYITTPTDFDDGLTAKQFDAFDNGDWHYVTLLIEARLEGIKLGEAYLGAFEYGSYTLTDDNDNVIKIVYVDLDNYLEDDNLIHDLTSEAIFDAEATLERLIEKAKEYANV